MYRDYSNILNEWEVNQCFGFNFQYLYHVFLKKFAKTCWEAHDNDDDDDDDDDEEEEEEEELIKKNI